MKKSFRKERREKRRKLKGKGRDNWRLKARRRKKGERGYKKNEYRGMEILWKCKCCIVW